MPEQFALRKLPPLLGQVFADLRECFRGDLLEYHQSLRDQTLERPAPKVLNDPIWHTVRIEPWEVVVLDSPLLQRLRDVRQLGLARYVFPSAGYSRFEHSVGVLNQTQRFIEAINRNARSTGVTKLDPVAPFDEIPLRLAALLHDVGHGFLSHVSERALGRLSLSNQDTLDRIRNEARQHFRCRKTPAVAEVIAALMVRLPEMTELLRLAGVPRWSDFESLQDEVSHLIVGSTRYPSRPFLSEIISGSVDADKLDYMARDCYMAGLPMPVDVERLLQKVHVVGVAARNLAPEYREGYGLGEDDVVHVFAIQEPGGRTVEELVVSRVLLYQKLYHHQKVRALEGMVENALDLLRQHSKLFGDLSTYLRLSDDEFIRGDWGPIEDSVEVRRARELVSAVRTRRPLVRAYAFNSHMYLDEVDEKSRRRAWSRIAAAVSRGRSPEFYAFRAEIASKAQRYLVATGDADAARRLDEHSLLIDMPEEQRIAEKTKFWVGDEHSGLALYSDQNRVERWAEAYEAQKTVGYVYCLGEHAVAVHVAMRELIFERANVDFDQRSLSLTKLRHEAVAEFIALLNTRGVETRPLPKPSPKASVVVDADEGELLRAFRPRVERLAAKFNTYQGEHGGPVDANGIVAWLAQFEKNDVQHAIRILEHVEFWDRQAIGDAIAKGLEDVGLAKGAVLVPMGGADKSSHHISYVIPTVRSTLNQFDLVVHASLQDLQPANHVIFFDDISASGKQGATTMRQYFGRPAAEWEVDEHIVEPATGSCLDMLKRPECRISFLFVTGRRQGAEHIVKVTRELVGHDRVDAHVIVPSEMSCFSRAARLFRLETEAAEATTAFQRAGRKALNDRLNDWGKEKLESRLLGYSNLAGLTVFYYNAPSATLTALWKENQDPSSRWKALFPRRTAAHVAPVYGPANPSDDAPPAV